MSLWLKQLGDDSGQTELAGRKLAILEPVDRTVGKVSTYILCYFLFLMFMNIHEARMDDKISIFEYSTK